jgi:hypothetical protein
MFTFPSGFQNTGKPLTYPLDYLVRSDLTQAISQPVILANGRVLDTVDEGMLAGQLTAVGAYTDIITNRIAVEGRSNWTGSGILSQQIPRQHGRVFQFFVRPDVSTTFMGGIMTSNSISNLEIAMGLYFNGGDYSISTYSKGVELTNHGVSTWTPDIEYLVSIVLDEVNGLAYVYIKGGSQYHVHTLIGAETMPADTDLYLGVSGRTWYNPTGMYSVPTALFPHLAQAGADTTDLDNILHNGKDVEAFRYWRMVIKSNGGSSVSSFAELELRDTISGTDLTEGMSIHSQSAGPGYKAIDGSINTIWDTPIATGRTFLAIDLVTPAKIIEYTIQARISYLTETPQSWDLEGSNEGTFWTFVHAGSTGAWPTNSEIRTFTI